MLPRGANGVINSKLLHLQIVFSISEYGARSGNGFFSCQVIDFNDTLSIRLVAAGSVFGNRNSEFAQLL